MQEINKRAQKRDELVKVRKKMHKPEKLCGVGFSPIPSCMQI
jgi:hypothetical protein